MERFWDVGFTVFVVLMSVVFHEYAHGWVADRLGDPTARLAGRLTLNPLKHVDVFGMLVFPLILKFLGLPPLGWAKPVPVNFYNLRHPRRDMMWVALAGPLTNLFLAFAASRVLLWTKGLIGGEFLVAVLMVNLILAAFNLVPIPPLDGGRVAVGLLPQAMAFRYAQIEPFGFLVVIVLLNFGALNFLDKAVVFLAQALLTFHF